VWGSVTYLVSPVTSGGLDKVIPTKTSRFLCQSAGREFGWSSIGVQVCLTLDVMLGFFFFDSASLRSMFSLVVIWFSHLAVIVRCGYVVPSMVLSQRRVQMR
jgi:hypothetical protein